MALEDTATISIGARHLRIVHYTFFVHILTILDPSLFTKTLLCAILQISFTWDGNDAQQVRSDARTKLNHLEIENKEEKRGGQLRQDGGERGGGAGERDTSKLT